MEINIFYFKSFHLKSLSFSIDQMPKQTLGIRFFRTNFSNLNFDATLSTVNLHFFRSCIEKLKKSKREKSIVLPEINHKVKLYLAFSKIKGPFCCSIFEHILSLFIARYSNYIFTISFTKLKVWLLRSPPSFDILG